MKKEKKKKKSNNMILVKKYGFKPPSYSILFITVPRRYFQCNLLLNNLLRFTSNVLFSSYNYVFKLSLVTDLTPFLERDINSKSK